MTVDRPQSFSEAAASTMAGGQIIAGGTAIQPALNRGSRADVELVSLTEIPEAWTLTETAPGRIRIGAMVPVGRLEKWGLAPRWFATPAVRRRATLIGNLLHPEGLRELLPLATACETTLLCCDVDGTITTQAPEPVPRGLVATCVEVTIPDVLIHQRSSVRASMSRPICSVTLAARAGTIRVVVAGTGVPTTVVSGIDGSSTAGEFVDTVVSAATTADAERLSVLARRTNEAYRRWQCTPPT